MRIALIVPGVGGYCRDGHERVIPVLLALIQRLAQRHEVLVVPLDQAERRRYPLLGATVATLGRTTGPGAGWLVGLQRLISVLRYEGARPDVLHAFWAGRPGAWAVAAGHLLRVPVVLSIGGGELVWLPQIGYGGHGSWLKRAKTSLVLRMADAVSACSRYSLGALTETREDALWLPWGVDWKLFDAPVERPPGPPWRLLHVASINQVKDQATLLRAVRLVVDHGITFELDCIGEDTLGGSLQRMSVELGLETIVRFHGFKPANQVVPFYRQAHLYVHSSLHESMAAVVLEAAAAGVPTVGTAVGLVAEMAPAAALAVPVQNPEALAKGILALVHNPEERVRLGRAAQQFARTYDADWTVAQFEALYARLSRNSRSAPLST